MAGTVEPAGSPRTQGDEVKLMFQLFDLDHDGKVTPEEMKRVLQTLDKELWTDAKVEKVLSAYDKNGDDALEFTEFWSWVSGHGGQSTEDFKPALLGRAVEEDREKRKVDAERRELAASKKKERDEKGAAKTQKDKEREEGGRLNRNEFVKQHVEAGLSKEVAIEMFAKGDEDHDGDMDAKERIWLAQDNAATTKQIRTLYQKTAGEDKIDAKGNLDVKSIDESGMDGVVKAFLAWDKDGSGSITPDELAQVLSTLNPKLGAKTVAVLAAELDTNKDGSIDIYEFVDWLSGEATKKKKMKKKAKKDRDAKIAASLQRQRQEK